MIVDRLADVEAEACIDAILTLRGCFDTATREGRDGRAIVQAGDQWICWVWQFECTCHLSMAAAAQFDRADAIRIADERLARQVASGECCRTYRHREPTCPMYEPLAGQP